MRAPPVRITWIEWGPINDDGTGDFFMLGAGISALHLYPNDAGLTLIEAQREDQEGRAIEPLYRIVATCKISAVAEALLETGDSSRSHPSAAPRAPSEPE